MNKSFSDKLLGLLVLIFLFLIIFVALFLLNKNSKNLSINNFNSPVNTKYEFVNYAFPKSNTLYSYIQYTDEQTIENAIPYRDVILIKKTDDMIQTKTIYANGYETDELVIVKDNQAILLGTSDINIREDMIYNYQVSMKNNIFLDDTSFTFLSAPIELNTTWKSSDNSVSVITNLDYNISLPFGEFSAIEVSTTVSDGTSVTDYYVNHIGLVQSVITYPDESKTTYVLESLADEQLISSSYIFQYDAYTNETSIDIVDNYISTNPIYIEILEDMLKYQSNATNTSLIDEKTYIQNVDIDRDENMTYIDFSSNFFKTKNYGKAINTQIITAIANEVGNFYNTKYVRITVNGNYSMVGEIDLDQTFSVDLQ